LNTGQWVIIGISAILVVWYFGANLYNRQKGVKTYRWLRKGLSTLGKIDQAGWLGSSSSGASLLVNKPSPPFRVIETSFLLETREILPWWIYNLSQGKHEHLLIKANLRKKPRQTIIIYRPEEAKKALKLLSDGGTQIESSNPPEGFRILFSEKEDEPGLNEIGKFLEWAGNSVQRITLQPEAPHLIVQAGISPILEIPAEDFFNRLKFVWVSPER
jgi:hypothetical protein